MLQAMSKLKSLIFEKQLRENQNHPSFNLEVGESRTFTVTLKSDKHINDLTHNHIRFEILTDKENTNTKTSVGTSVEIFPTKQKSRDKWLTLPMKSGVGYAQDNKAKSFFFETEGKGYIDQAKKQHLDLLVRLP